MIPGHKADEAVTGGPQPDLPGAFPETPGVESATQHNTLRSSRTPRSHGLTDTGLPGEDTSGSNTPSGNHSYQQKGGPAPPPRTQGIDVVPLTKKGTAGAPQQAAGSERGSSKPGADSQIGDNHNNFSTSDSIQGRQPTSSATASSEPYSQKDVSAVPENTTRSDDRHVQIKGSGPTQATEAAAAATARGSERDIDHHQPRGAGVYNTVVGQGSHEETPEQRGTGDEATNSEGITTRAKESLVGAYNTVGETARSQDITTRVKGGLAGAHNTVVGQGNREEAPGAGHNSEPQTSSSLSTSSPRATRDEVAKPEPIPTRVKEALAGAGVHNTVIGAGSNEEGRSVVNYQRAFPLMPSQQASHAPDDSTKQRRDSPSKPKENPTEAGIGAGAGASSEHTRGDNNPYAQKHVTDVPRAQPEPRHHQHGRDTALAGAGGTAAGYGAHKYASRDEEKQRSPQDYASSYDVGNPYTQEHPSIPPGMEHGVPYLNYGPSRASAGTGAARETTGRDSTGYDNDPYTQKDVSAVPESDTTSSDAGRNAGLAGAGAAAAGYGAHKYARRDDDPTNTTSSQHEPTVTTGTTEGSVPAETNAQTRGAGAYTRADPVPQQHRHDNANYAAAGAGAAGAGAGAAASRTHQKTTDNANTTRRGREDAGPSDHGEYNVLSDDTPSGISQQQGGASPTTRSSPTGLRKPSASAQGGNASNTNDTARSRSSADSSRGGQYKVLSSGTPSGVNLDNRH
ncbi:hypothetical protein DL766_004280 [Monosporascus sp. MC13-8B]|uniref:CsbD-like domain-containing protein n=1 Tax=Monosporascus cannonballus TaxID=155416 RepID=A0ABY0HEK4_9PEZI|nr:hypothetical protein DL762_003496 [Monosporascus cannonballus]RYP31738.1 hypothetical protein DL766_004280 [Monosporascus sp. MC13-8B]